MNTDESSEKAQARADVEAAMKRFVDIVAKEREITDSPIVIGWVAYAEYTSIELEREDSTGNVVIVPDNQQFSLSRGLFECGNDSFRRG
jgi:hypothetical protein